MELRIQIILGSTREGRFSEKAGAYIFEELKKREGIQAELIDLRDWPLPFYDQPFTPSSATGPYSHDIANKWKEKVGEADGYIIILPEYNHGYPAVLKNALDWVFNEWNNKPIGFVSYGSAMGTRSVEQMRQVAVELQMVPIRNAVHLPVEVLRALRAAENPLDPELWESLREPLDKVNGFFDQLLWWARVLKPAREQK